MSVTRSDVERMAHLARLSLDEAETARLATELGDILDHMAELGSLDLADVAPFGSAAEHVALPRPDSVGADTLDHGPGASAPEWRDGFFAVPRLIGGGAAPPK